jgi:hypothetical protein
MDDLDELECLDIKAHVGDLILYIDDCSLILSRIVNFEENVDTIDGYHLCINDIKLIRKAHDDHQLEDGYTIFVNDVFKNFGNITLEEFEENYPEWII